MFKVTPCFPKKTKDTYASTQSLMTMSMSLFNPKISHNTVFTKNPQKNKNVSPFKYHNSVSQIERLERRSLPKNKSYFNGSFYKDTFYHIEKQNGTTKQKNAFRISVKKHSGDSMIFDRKKKLRQKKHQYGPQGLKSSNLSDIYSELYDTYESVPFELDQRQEQMIIDKEKSIKEIGKLDQIEKKIKKQFEVKQLTWENNLRKEIKSLTKDTDQILSLQFRDLRDVRR